MIDAAAQQRLAAFLRGPFGGKPVTVTGVAPIGGGMSRVMYKVDVSVDGVARSLVTRSDPPPDRSVAKTDRRAEWNVLDALTRHGKVALPAAYCFDGDGEVFGQPMIVSDYVPSKMLVAALRSAPRESFALYAEQLADLAASIHAVDVSAMPSLAVPTSWDAYIDTRIEEWRALEREHYERDPFIRYLAVWLDKHRPAPAPLGLVHSDFHAGNVLEKDGGGLIAVDWEFTHIGDPRIDLGWFLLMAGIMPPDLMTAEFDVFLKRYRLKSGLSEAVINRQTIAYFQIMAGASLFGGVMKQTSALARGEVSNVSLLYISGVVCLGHELWFGVSQALQAALTQAKESA